MEVSLFDYDLPPERIAQRPLAERDNSRLLRVPRWGAKFSDRHFRDLPDLLQSGDLLVLNDTRVLPARLLGRKESGGAVEAFLVRPQSPDPGATSDPTVAVWQALFKSSKKLRPGQRLLFNGGLSALVLEPSGSEPGLLRLESCDGRSLAEVIEEVGHMPLPPYIKREDEAADRSSYQTVFADYRATGAVAAPTAGLHFTSSLLQRLQAAGVEIAFLTLHVGLGTFAPVRCRLVQEHRIHQEYYRIPALTLERIEALRRRGGRLVAVGTTVTRALEYYALTGRESGLCDLFIFPGFDFKMVDALLTNFHLPASTLMMLVSAFAGREKIMSAYRHALANEYRFYSYGDAMLIS